MKDNNTNKPISELINNNTVVLESDKNMFGSITWYGLDEKGFLKQNNNNALGVMNIIMLNIVGVYIYINCN